MGALALLFILLVLAGDEAPSVDNGFAPPEPPPPLPPLPDTGVIPAELELPPFEEPMIPEEGEPPVPPGPIVRPIPDEPPDDGMTPEQWMTGLQGIVSEQPKQGAFWMVKQGYTMHELTDALLTGGTETGSNRVRLIKCMTAVPWNHEHYAADAGRQTWGTVYDVEGVNLSQAWMPRHPSAMQALANRQNPLRGITMTGQQIGTGGYYGLLWIPTFVATKDTLACAGAGQGPPQWLMSRLQG